MMKAFTASLQERWQRVFTMNSLQTRHCQVFSKTTEALTFWTVPHVGLLSAKTHIGLEFEAPLRRMVHVTCIPKVMPSVPLAPRLQCICNPRASLVAQPSCVCNVCTQSIRSVGP